MSFSRADIASGTIELTPEQAFHVAGVPIKLSESLQRQSESSGAAIAMRAPSQCVFPKSTTFKTRPVHPEPSPSAAPKPLTVKAKCSNWGPMDTHVVEKEASIACGKSGKDGAVRKHSDYDLPKKDGKVALATVPCRESLSVIDAKLQAGIYQLVGDGTTGKPGELQLRDVSTGNPKAEGVIFTYDLSVSEEKKSEEKKSEMVAPAWWKEDKWGKFSEKSEMSFPVDYTADGVRKPLMIYAVPDEKGHPHEITSDFDPLWFSRKAEDDTVPDRFHKEINTLTVDGAESMLDALWDLDQVYAEQGQERMFKTIDDIPDRAIAQMGYITPFEAYAATKANKEYLANAGMTSELESANQQAIKAPLQHGADMRIKGQLSETNEVVHYWNGKIFLSKMESVPAFLLKDNAKYLKENFFEVNANVEMKSWAPVIAKQIELGQKARIPAQTLENYTKYQKEQKELKSKEPRKSRSEIISGEKYGVTLPSVKSQSGKPEKSLEVSPKVKLPSIKR